MRRTGKIILSMTGIALLTGAAMALGRLISAPDIATARALSWLVLALSGWLAHLVARELTGSLAGCGFMPGEFDQLMLIQLQPVCLAHEL